MNSRPPPVPEENRSDKGVGDHAKPSISDPHKPDMTVDPDKKGQQGNSRINTSHQGHQQDR
ncbi:MULTISPECIES: hypothetical protein [Rhizobium]|uniref:Uncharacterized protein n=1 Tax=Rhizobium dioscoreae TaxID=2653122 RepID=A0ABQ0Z605_9HYPH|nr:MULTISPECIES: hypothetical protein [Rhizobium]TWB13140.1 hypothetical protein FBZ99_10510 [Rhizobium sp. ERR1071]TWB53297.1 hypothetical protein FBZ98_104224 [Rhizobium sp. ERR 922]TWB95739.1 hypothetical protein FBZ97_104427 [Rhizobium sp. ERR 942]GES50971.1 hypothetical protein RsS93_35850 [Rhizobium dioscoreae]